MEIKSNDDDRFVRVLEFNREKKIHFAWWMTNFVAIDILRREKIDISSRATWISESVPSISSFSMFVSLMTQFGASSAISYFIILWYANEPAPKSIFLLSQSVRLTFELRFDNTSFIRFLSFDVIYFLGSICSPWLTNLIIYETLECVSQPAKLYIELSVCITLYLETI